MTVIVKVLMRVENIARYLLNIILPLNFYSLFLAFRGFILDDFSDSTMALLLINCSTISLHQYFLLEFLLMLVGNVNRVQYGKKRIPNILVVMVVKYELVKWSVRWTENWWNNQACGEMISGKRSILRLVTSAGPQLDIVANAVLHI